MIEQVLLEIADLKRRLRDLERFEFGRQLVVLSAPLTWTANNAAVQTLDLTVSPFSLPAGVRAVQARLGFASVGAGSYGALMSASGQEPGVVAMVDVAGIEAAAAGLVVCSSGSIYFDTNDSTDTAVEVVVFGYYL